MNKILAQDEVEALLQGLSGGRIESDLRAVGADGSVVAFVPPRFEPPEKKRPAVLEMLNSRFLRFCSDDVARVLRIPVGMRLLNKKIVSFDETQRSSDAFFRHVVFRIQPFAGTAFLEMDARLIFAMVEASFGGSASRSYIEGRSLTRIEQTVVDRIFKSVLKSLEHAWKFMHEVTVERLPEEGARSEEIVPEASVVSLRYEMTLHGQSGCLMLCIPHEHFDSRAGMPHAASQKEHVWEKNLKDRLMEAPVEMTVELGRARLTGNQLLHMQVGDVLVLDAEAGSLLCCRVGGIPKYQGVVGRMKTNKAFRIVKEVESK